MIVSFFSAFRSVACCIFRKAAVESFMCHSCLAQHRKMSIHVAQGLINECHRRVRGEVASVPGQEGEGEDEGGTPRFQEAGIQGRVHGPGYVVDPRGEAAGDLNDIVEFILVNGCHGGGHEALGHLVAELEDGEAVRDHTCRIVHPLGIVQNLVDLRSESDVVQF